MQCRIRDFRCKEVINVCDGCRLGYVSDLDVRVPEGQVVAIIVYGPAAFSACSAGGGVLHPLGVHPADRRRHHPHRQALSAAGSPLGAEAAQALLTNAPAAFTAGAFAYAGGAVTAPPDRGSSASCRRADTGAAGDGQILPLGKADGLPVVEGDILLQYIAGQIQQEAVQVTRGSGCPEPLSPPCRRPQGRQCSRTGPLPGGRGPSTPDPAGAAPRPPWAVPR